MSDPSYYNSPSNALPGPLSGQYYRFAPTYIRGRNPTTSDLKPKENQGFYPVGSFWVNSAGPEIWVLLDITSSNFITVANWVPLTTQTGAILSLSDNANTPVYPSSPSATPPDNIQLTGQLNESSGSFQTVTANASSNLIKFNPMSSARWIVDPLSTTPYPNGTHTTIQSAINSAATGDTIVVMPGTYVENLTLNSFAGTNLVICGMPGDSNVGVVIQGKASLSTAKLITFSNINFVTNADFFLSVTGSVASLVNLEDCFLNCTGSAVGIQFTSSSASSQINVLTTNGDCAGTSAMFTHSSAGTLNFKYCFLTNSGSSTTSNTASAGVLNIVYCEFLNTITLSGTVQGSFNSNHFDTVVCDRASIITSSSGATQTFRFCDFNANTQPALTINAPASIAISECIVTSNATNAMTGNGTIAYTEISGTGNVFASTLTVTNANSCYSSNYRVNNKCDIRSGSGSPNGALTAPKGSLYLRTDGTGTTDRAYINTDGGTTWTAITTVA